MLRTLGVGVLVGASVVTTGALAGRDLPPPATASRVVAEPSSVARPRYLSTTYVAPPSRKPVTALGRLRLSRLDIDAPVVAVGWDHEAMAVPNDPATLGWFEPSAHLADRLGSTLIAGHVSDSVDRPGALWRLTDAQRGDVVEWRPRRGPVLRFRVMEIVRYPRTNGLPPALLRSDGPHTLRLVTCTNRRSDGDGFHYADNLVVSAVELP